jgi:hypothetical protein
MNDTQAPLQGVEWREATITLAGSKEVMPGKQLGETGLGYWSGKDDEGMSFHVPSHIPSGFRMALEPFFSEKVCQRYIQSIAPLIHWNQPFEMLVLQPYYPPSEVGILYRRFHLEDAAATAGDGRW